MARYDVFAGRTEGSYLLDVQSDLLDNFKTRVVDPASSDREGAAAVRKLHPISRSTAGNWSWPPI